MFVLGRSNTLGADRFVQSRKQSESSTDRFQEYFVVPAEELHVDRLKTLD